MRKLVLLFACAAPLPLLAQAAAPAIVQVAPNRCVWRAGDNPAWAAPALDESGWLPFTQYKLTPSESRLWIRCRIDSGPLRGLDHPAVQIRLGAAYEVFLNGSSIAHNGNLRNGHFSMNLIRIFPAPPALLHSGSNLLALRISRRYDGLFALPAFWFVPEIRLGDQLILTNDRAGFLEEQLPGGLLTDVPFMVIGIIGVVLLGFFLYDPSRLAPIVLAVSCIAVSLIFTALLSATLMLSEPAGLYVAMTAITSALSIGSQYCFPFALVRRRIPCVFWLPLGLCVVFGLWNLVEALVSAPLSLRLDAIQLGVIVPANFVVQALLGTASIVAFWPWSRVPAQIRPIARLALVWGITQSIFFIALLTTLNIPGIPDLFSNWMLPVSTIAEFFVIAAIIALNLRDQRQVALDRAALAGEIQAAQQIQRTLVPASIDALPGFDIAVAFLPAREVGGDFYSCHILAGSRQRILLGDVSGKGAAAAMTAAVLLGAAQRHDTDSPVELLRHLNLVLTDMRLGGFVTCLCGELSAAGILTLANAGHLPPYRNGEETPLDSGLPLGIASDPGYTESTLQLAPGDALTFLSDGVVEAQSAAGELFGFDRSRSISTRSAQDIAAAALQFGQQDDITVLTVAWSPAGPMPQPSGHPELKEGAP